MNIKAPVRKMVFSILIAASFLTTATIIFVLNAENIANSLSPETPDGLIAALRRAATFSPIGIVWGMTAITVLNIAKIFWIYNVAERASQMDSAGKSFGYIALSANLRNLLTIAVLVGVHFTPGMELLGAIVGLIAFQIGAYSLRSDVGQQSEFKRISNTEYQAQAKAEIEKHNQK